MLLLFGCHLTLAQKKYDSKTIQDKVTLEGKSIIGYSTNFDFNREEVRYGWWSYSRKFGNPVNMKSYYKVIIPSSTNDGNQDMMVYTQTLASPRSGVTFFLGVENQEYSEQCKSLVIAFKKKFFIDQIVEKIEHKEARAKELGEKYEKEVLDDKKQDYLNELDKILKEIVALREEIKEIEKE